MPRPGEVVLDKYRLDRLVGLGGMGVVMEARLLQLDERVAIKFLLPELAESPEAVARFEREAKVLFRMKSPHVCRVHELGKLPAGVPFLVMEYLEGRDLASGLRLDHGLPVGEAIGYLLQACHAVAEAHARGIVHRDLKPENLFVDEGHGDPCLKVLDFGLSKLATQAPDARRERMLTAPQQAMGTPQYMAPEQWVSATDVGPSADQWALGAILFELLTGRPPFDAEDIGRICSQTLNAPTPSLRERRPDAPAGLELVLRKCLEKHPSQRYESVGALAVALAAFAPADALPAAERLRAMLDSEDSDASWSRFPMPARLPSMPSDLRPTRRRLRERVVAVTASGRRSPIGLWLTLGTVGAAIALVFVLLASEQALTAEALAPTAPAMPEIRAEPRREAPPRASASASAPVVARPRRPAAPAASAQPSASAGLFDSRW